MLLFIWTVLIIKETVYVKVLKRTTKNDYNKLKRNGVPKAKLSQKKHYKLFTITFTITSLYLMILKLIHILILMIRIYVLLRL